MLVGLCFGRRRRGGVVIGGASETFFIFSCKQSDGEEANEKVSPTIGPR